MRYYFSPGCGDSDQQRQPLDGIPRGSWLEFGSFFVVALGIVAVIIGFLSILLFLNTFEDGTQALGFLTALFGAITGLVGTYFGVKTSSDAREGHRG
jgi:hypothetical protein